MLSAISMALAESFIAYFQLSLSIELALHLATVFFSGFLFGMTYRYAVRDDNNPHLKSGVVLAFGLVRGLAEIEGSSNGLSIELANLLPLFESLGLFAIAGILLDSAIRHQWVKPMKRS
ncbi:MAG: hypothetical protein J7641_05530 [Cyanobacteria bacterium SID2]|nr:hypothetical protein [Cyanobacteria bacterium SID2]MBP0003188.1 hypothetical protein [Cyanobacteria bacterium SBC]